MFSASCAGSLMNFAANQRTLYSEAAGLLALISGFRFVVFYPYNSRSGTTPDALDASGFGSI